MTEEWELRVQLAAAYRRIDHFGWPELIWTHTTVRVPGQERHFPINPYGYRFDEVCASNLGKVETMKLPARRIRPRSTSYLRCASPNPLNTGLF